MADQDRGIDVAATAQLLTERFSGEWLALEWLSAEDEGAKLFAQFKPDAYGRKVVTGLLLIGSVITADSLRTISVGSLESMVMEMGHGGPDEAAAQLRHDLAQLPTPGREGRTKAEFLRVVADHFKVWARYTPSPATQMATEWRVNRATMASWVRSARLAGLLPPARRGKASDPEEIAFQKDLDAIMTMPPGPEREAGIAAVYRKHGREY